MSVRVRLTRVGSKKNAMWRVVVADQRSPRDGRFIEMIGHYNPQTEPSQIVIDRERLDHWLRLGARPSDTVRKLIRAENTPAGATATVGVKPETGAKAPPKEESEAGSEGAEASVKAQEPVVEAEAGEATEASADEDAPAEAEAPGADAAAAEPDDSKSG